MAFPFLTFLVRFLSKATTRVLYCSVNLIVIYYYYLLSTMADAPAHLVSSFTDRLFQLGACIILLTHLLYCCVYLFRIRKVQIPDMPWGEYRTDIVVNLPPMQKPARRPSRLFRPMGGLPAAAVNRNLPDHSGRRVPRPSLAGSNAPAVCKAFNQSACTFNPCRFKHKCLRCGGPHPVSACR